MTPPESAVQTLLKSDDCLALASDNKQVTFLRDLMKNESHPTLASYMTGHIFGIE
jgi:hypothetical protein